MTLNGYVKGKDAIFIKWIILTTFITLTMIAINLAYGATKDSNKTITLTAKNMSLIEVMRVVQKQSGMPFFINGSELANLQINVIVQNLELSKALDKIIQDRNLKWFVDSETIIIQPLKSTPKNEKNIRKSASYELKQEKPVRGRVVDEDGIPIAGVTITIKGTSIVTATKSNGEFSILPRNSQDILVFSTLGHNTQNITIGAQEIFDITLTKLISDLEEVVVVGYSTLNKKEITGSVSIISVDEMKQVPASNTEQMLQGRASGLNITTSGSPGSGSNIRIRGITSFGNNTPLVIIDGVQGELADINASDIESVQVLKDAGAAAIYGVRGSNGVIVVTTKKGKTEQAKVAYEGYYGIQSPPSGNVYNLLNTQEMADVTWKAFKNSGQVDANGNPSHLQYGNGPSPVIPDYIVVGNASGVIGSLTQAQLDQYNIDYTQGNIYQIVAANKTGTDWFHEIFKTAPQQSHTVSASAASAKSNYFFSTGYLNQQGTLIDTYLKRYSLRANTSFKIKDNIRVGENLYVFHRNSPSAYTGIQNTSDVGNPIMLSFMMQPIIPVFDIMGNYAGTRARGLGQSPNPYAVAVQNGGYQNTSWTAQGNVFGEVNFLNHFLFKSSFGGFVRSGNTSNFLRRTYENAENNATNSYTEGSTYSQQWTFTNTLEYTQKINKHNIKALAGLEAVEFFNRTLGGSSAGYFSDDSDYLTLTSGSGNYTNLSNKTKYTLYSQFVKLDYNYDDKYIVGATLRRDGSSRFSKSNRWGVFPAFSAGWRMSEETFLKNTSWLSNLMIRGSWGILGNQLNVDPSNAFTQFNSGLQTSYYDLQGSGSKPTQGFILSKIGNQETGWEEDRLSNIGVDVSILNGTLDFSAEYYQKKISGLLFIDQSPATAGGATLPTVNIGNIQNKGVDFNINYHLKKEDFTFDLGLNMTHYKSKVIELPNDYFDTGTTRTGNFVRNKVGQPVGAFFGYQIEGLFRDADDVAKSPTQNAAAPGRFKYADKNGDNKITDADRTFIGDPNPDFTYGINLNANYKKIGLSLFFLGSQGNDAVNYQKWWTDFFPSLQGVKSKDLLYNSWTPQNLDAKTPIIENQSNFSNNAVPNSYYIENASFLKLKNVMLSYTFDDRLFKRVGIDRLRVYLQVTNLFTLTKYTGLDPEIGGTDSAFGIDYGNYPNNQRNYNVGLSFGF